MEMQTQKTQRLGARRERKRSFLCRNLDKNSKYRLESPLQIFFCNNLDENQKYRLRISVANLSFFAIEKF